MSAGVRPEAGRRRPHTRSAWAHDLARGTGGHAGRERFALSVRGRRRRAPLDRAVADLRRAAAAARPNRGRGDRGRGPSVRADRPGLASETRCRHDFRRPVGRADRRPALRKSGRGAAARSGRVDRTRGRRGPVRQRTRAGTAVSVGHAEWRAGGFQRKYPQLDPERAAVPLSRLVRRSSGGRASDQVRDGGYDRGRHRLQHRHPDAGRTGRRAFPDRSVGWRGHDAR